MLRAARIAGAPASAAVLLLCRYGWNTPTGLDQVLRTRGSFSVANFTKGSQQTDAAQAVAFVRLRRDTAHLALNFTDLDRERCQQAFIASLAHQLRQAGALADPKRRLPRTSTGRGRPSGEPRRAVPRPARHPLRRRHPVCEMTIGRSS